MDTECFRMAPALRKSAFQRNTTTSGWLAGSNVPPQQIFRCRSAPTSVTRLLLAQIHILGNPLFESDEIVNGRIIWRRRDGPAVPMEMYGWGRKCCGACGAVGIGGHRWACNCNREWHLRWMPPHPKHLASGSNSSSSMSLQDHKTRWTWMRRMTMLWKGRLDW